MLDKKLSRIGKVTVHRGQIDVEGYVLVAAKSAAARKDQPTESSERPSRAPQVGRGASSITRAREGEASLYVLREIPGEGCAYPYYGLAPHTHERQSAEQITTKLAPKDEWPDNFSEDPEAPGCGIYTHCPECGAAP